MSYQINKGIPIPIGSPQAAKYPWAQMEAGDSFSFLPEEKRTVRAAASNFARTHKGYQFKLRGDRIWCTQAVIPQQAAE